jgi:hypothetical protein
LIVALSLSRYRNTIREKVGVVIDELTRRKVSAVIELSFHEDPNSTTGARIKTLALESLESRTPILGEDITVNVSILPYIALDTYTLYPSPKYFWERYRFRERSEWFGKFSQCMLDMQDILMR